jgi:hypothetical protein
MYPDVLLMYFISAAVILLAFLALKVQVSLPYNNTGRASVLYNFILVFLRVFCDLKTLFKVPVILRSHLWETNIIVYDFGKSYLNIKCFVKFERLTPIPNHLVSIHVPIDI